MRNGLLLCAAAASLSILCTESASGAADGIDREIRLQDKVLWRNSAGQDIQTIGTILTESDEQIEIRSAIGTFPIKKASVKEILRRNPVENIYKALVKAMKARASDMDRAARNLEIGLFCVRPNPALGGEPPLRDRAFDHLYKAVQINSRLVEAYPYLLDHFARIREARGDAEGTGPQVEEEVDVYMLAKAAGFEHTEIEFRLAEILRGRLDRTDEAVKIYERILKGSTKPRVHSLERQARRRLAEIRLEQGDLDGAIRVFTSNAGDDPKSPAAFEGIYEIARLRAARGTPADRAEARKLFQKAREIQPDFPGIARYLAALDYADGKVGQAKAWLLGPADEGTDDPGLKVDLAVVEIQAGRFESALKRLDEVLGEPIDEGPAPEAPASDAAPADGSAPPGPAPSAPAGPAPEGGVTPGSFLPGGTPPAGDAPAAPAVPVPAGEGAPAPASTAAPAAAPAIPVIQPSGPRDPERSRAYLARGFILQCRGRQAAALGQYRRAYAADPSSGTAAIAAAGGELQAGNGPGARAILGGLIQMNADRRGLFAAYARILADVEMAEGKARKALNLLEYASGIEPNDPILQKKIGVLLLELGETDRAAARLEAARKQIPKDTSLLNALGCLRYQRGEFEDAVKLFREVQGSIPVPEAREGKAPPPVPPDRQYADRAIQLSQDALQLEVWTDDFNRGTGEELARSWREVESYGITVSIQDGKVLFAGQQANDPTGVTLIQRDEVADNVDRISVRLRFDAQSGRVRAGIRMESFDARGATPSAGLVFFRDYDGVLRYARKTTRSGWEDGQSVPEKEQGRNKPFFTGLMKWPDDGAYHTLFIRRSLAGSSTAYDLLLDGKPVALNIVVDGLRAKNYNVGVSGQAEALGAAYRFEVEDFRLYRIREITKREIQR